MKPRIEVEHRSRFDKNEHSRLHRFLRQHARHLGRDDKEVFFYVSPTAFYKVVKNISTKSAKIVLKKSRLERASSFHEIEIAISPKDIKSANELLATIPRTKLYHEKILRENFLWQGVEIALKYSRAWGYHAELEILIFNRRDLTNANKKILSVAKELGIKLMTNNDIAKFLRAGDKQRNS